MARTPPVAPDEADCEPDEITWKEYYNGFHGGSPDAPKVKMALQVAHEIRKFEIDLYWKRATYFWAFIGAALVGYFAALNALKDPTSDVLFAINCLGFVFSVAWYFANRGSKYWQENWERHVDMLENQVTGPIYKTVVSRSMFPFEDAVGPYPFSVSKLNTLLSLYVIFIWIFLGVRSISTALNWVEVFPGSNLVILIVATTVFAFHLKASGQTGHRKLQPPEERYRFVRRDAPEPPESAPGTTSSQDSPRAKT